MSENALIKKPLTPEEEAQATKERILTKLNTALQQNRQSEGAELTAQATAVRTEIIPADAPQHSTYSTIRQGTSTNALTKLRATEGKNATVDIITGTATIKSGNFTLTIPNYAQLTGLRTTTYQLLDAITIALTETGAKSPTVVIPLDDYMKRRGLKDRKDAKAQAKADLEVLRGASFTWEEKRGKNTNSYAFVNLADSGEIRRNGDIVFTFGSTFFGVLKGYPVMPYPAQLQTLNSKRNPNSYYLLRKITEHKNMNVGKKNEDTIAVKTLLAVAPYIPSYAEVMAGNKNVTDRIINAFERDMDALGDTLTWHYCHSNGVQLTDEELQGFSYELFKDCLIKTVWKDYPDQTARLERKAERQEEAKAKKKKPASKKKKAEAPAE